MTSRRNLLKTLALTPLVGVFASSAEAKPIADATEFILSLNTSTVRGQKLSLPQLIELAAREGYQGLEPWMMEIEGYLKGGKSIAFLYNYLTFWTLKQKKWTFY
ncbi:MAG: twin-arginine translocation signal domain-containing protein [Bacteroidetes bacterium]|nr:twin-arginine translocation signal domain-containing protein [Bacteroidota bacterium]MDA1267804.1 twin-arginine translocation signal domain-containing protein [Bacteroidota bacterium]